MLIAPATARPLAIAAMAANPIASPIADASLSTDIITRVSDESANTRAATVSRSLGAGRGGTSTPQDATPTPTAPPLAPAAPPPPTPPTVDDARAFALAQIGPAQFDCLDTLWQHESDWDPTAENPSSGAYGIAQALPAAKMSSVADDWASNPVTQVSWGLDYIATRYGSACNAWSFWLNHYPHWY